MAKNIAPLFFIFITSYFLSVHSQSEQQTLLQIKKDFGNPDSLQSWNNSIHHCNWIGVSCTSNHVTSITLSSFTLQEPIPDSICKLTHLSHLDLSYNNIPGSFPTNLYTCTSLLHLDISQNRFVGFVPVSVNQLSKKLKYLSLSANNFTGNIPASIGDITSLQYLLLDSNLFNGTFPAEFGKLSNLEQLWLAYNPFKPSKIPEEFGFLRTSKRHCPGSISDSPSS